MEATDLFALCTSPQSDGDSNEESAGYTSLKAFSTFAVVLPLALGIIIGVLIGFQAAYTLGIDKSHIDSLGATSTHTSGQGHIITLPTSPRSKLLVLYSFYDGDEVSWDNLLFFLAHAISPDDGVTYIIILNGLNSLQDPRLPPLPANARFVLHQNECYDWGTYSWALRTQVKQQEYTCVLHGLA